MAQRQTYMAWQRQTSSSGASQRSRTGETAETLKPCLLPSPSRSLSGPPTPHEQAERPRVRENRKDNMCPPELKVRLHQLMQNTWAGILGLSSGAAHKGRQAVGSAGLLTAEEHEHHPAEERHRPLGKGSDQSEVIGAIVLEDSLYLLHGLSACSRPWKARGRFSRAKGSAGLHGRVRTQPARPQRPIATAASRLATVGRMR